MLLLTASSEFPSQLDGFTVVLLEETPNLKAKLLEAHPSVILIEPDWLFQKATIHTPEFLELLRRVWPLNGRADHAGKGIVIGMLDTSIDPKHPSTNEIQNHRYDPLEKWKGWYFVTDMFPYGSCNGRIIGAQHFSKGLIAAILFNATHDFDSLFDEGGHGT
ncbi:unnamed protein product [Sphagnum jensenii]|uniref:Uncharacterized protein n=1 Tax=Sphagnum jensenii TaxID=128206 RepID=A0ABP0XG43_9BRYO